MRRLELLFEELTEDRRAKLVEFADQLVQQQQRCETGGVAMSISNAEHIAWKDEIQGGVAPAPPPFQLGDLVRLKSGGPRMTVETGLRIDGLITVTWFVGEENRRDAFQPECLELMPKAV